MKQLLKELRNQFSWNEWMTAIFFHIPTAGKYPIIKREIGVKRMEIERKSFNQTAQSWLQ
jgi:hypothetical protein